MINQIYYAIKPIIPRGIQILLRRKLIERKLSSVKSYWPILESASEKPEGWNGWKNGKKFALILTHDVELQIGHDRVKELMSIEKELGFCSSFNFVPERYNVSPYLRNEIIENGFEVGVHGLSHDGKLYKSRETFAERAIKINNYIKEWDAAGFRSPAMHHNLEWLKDLNILYDASTFDTDPFEPQSDGVKTIFPFWVSKGNDDGYVELPYTLPQDFTLFILMNHKTNDLWKRKLDWIAAKGGMALLNVHPDYINFHKAPGRIEEFPIDLYRDFLLYVKEKYAGEYWNPLPKDAAQYYKDNLNDDTKNIHYNRLYAEQSAGVLP
jgi:hypothetical protein